MDVTYRVQKVNKDNELYGKTCLANNMLLTYCGKEMDEKWYILEHSMDNSLESKITCKKCKEKLEQHGE